jgi:hypothetical protein
MTKEQLETIRTRLDAADPQYWSHDGSCFGECCSTEAERQVAMHALTDLRALLNEIERLAALRDDLFAWAQRFSNLVGEDGITEASRCDAFAKLYDAAKAAGKLVRE